jgi:hypothetical protein
VVLSATFSKSRVAESAVIAAPKNFRQQDFSLDHYPLGNRNKYKEYVL